jgi:hypothetical protein
VNFFIDEEKAPVFGDILEQLFWCKPMFYNHLVVEKDNVKEEREMCLELFSLLIQLLKSDPKEGKYQVLGLIKRVKEEHLELENAFQVYYTCVTPDPVI